MNVYHDRGVVSALVAGLLVVTGVAFAVVGIAGTGAGWGLWAGAGLAVVIGVVVLTRIETTTTTVDETERTLTIEHRRLAGAPSREVIAFDAIDSVAARHIGLDEEYSEHALVLVLTDGSRRRLANHMSPERIDAVRDAIRGSLER
jgi:hypothetical protein